MRFGQAQRVDLHAVAEDAEFWILDAVTIAGGLFPELAECTHLAHLFDEADAGVDKEADPSDDLLELFSLDLAAFTNQVEGPDGVGQGEGQFLRRRRTCLLQMIGADVRRVPFRDIGQRILVHLGDHAQALLRRKDVGAPGEVFLDDIVLRGPLQQSDVFTAFPGQRHIERQQPHRSGVDGHRGVHLLKGNAFEESVEVFQAVDRYADLADLRASNGMIGGVAALGGQIKGDREAGLPFVQIGAVEFVGLAGVGVASVGSKDPWLVAGHRAFFVHNLITSLSVSFAHRKPSERISGALVYSPPFLCHSGSRNVERS